MTIHQGIEKILTPYCKQCNEKKASTVETILGKYK